MPKQTKSQAISHEGERWFTAQLPSTWIPQLPTYDVGVDMLVVICEEGPLNGLEFRAQVKSTSTFQVRDDCIVLNGFRRTALTDLLHGFIPALLVLYESTSKKGYCYWANQLLANNMGLLSPPNKTVTLLVPMTRPIEQSLWSQLGNQVSGIMAAVGNRIAHSELSIPLLETTHALMQSLHLIDLCAHDEGGSLSVDELLTAEATAHKEIVTTLRSLDDRLSEICNPIIGVRQTAEKYSEACGNFIKNFDRFVHHSDSGSELQVAPELMFSHRVEAFRAVTQVVSKLSLLSLESARTRERKKAVQHKTKR